MMSFRKVIQARAREMKISGYRIAQLSGVPMRTVQAYLAGDVDASGERVAKIAEALGLELKLKTKEGR